MNYSRGINGLVMPEELSRIICDFARVRVPDDKLIGINGCCNICFGRRECVKLHNSKTCKACYYRYGGGGFDKTNTYKEYDKCLKCDIQYPHTKHKEYKNCPLCVKCYFEEKEKINQYKGTNNCACGTTKAKAFAFCFECNKIGNTADRMIEVIRQLELKNSG